MNHLLHFFLTAIAGSARSLLLVALLAAAMLPAPARADTPTALPTGLTPADWQAIQAQLPAVAQPKALADGLSRRAYLKAGNAGAGDWFGYSVAISGDTVVVGAPYEDSAGSDPDDNSAADAGAAYVFVRNGTAWTQQAYLKAGNAEAYDFFGYSVAISGDTVVVGALGEDSAGSDPDDNSATGAGAAYVFVRNGTVWTQQAYLKAGNAEAYDLFGTSVAISGDTVVVGAPYEDSAGSDPDDNSATSAGVAYVFVRNGTVWSQQAYLKAGNADAYDYFGNAVAISGDTVVVGAPYEDSAGSDPDDNSAADAGAAYVFVRNGTVWTQQAYLKAGNAEAYDLFGTSVAISGDTVVVGAYHEDSAGSDPDDNSATRAGAAYVFARNGVVWSQQAYLKAGNADAYDYFGNAVAISGDTVVVGAYYEGSAGNDPDDNSATDAGATYVFVRNGTVWTQQAYLKAGNANAGDLFGYAVAISGDTVVVGALGEDSAGSDPDDNSVTNAGAAYVFAPGYRVGGSLAGLASSGLVLHNNAGDAITPNVGDTSFSFPTLLFDGDTYAVTVATQPIGQTCTVSDGSGTISGADVDTVQVTCVTHQYAVSASVSGANGSITADPPGTSLPLTIDHGDSASFTVIPDAGYHIVEPLGGDCPAGTLTGTSYVTGPIVADCQVIASFVQNAAAAVSVQGGDAQSAPVLAAFADVLTVRVADAADVPLPGITVTFTAPGTGASAVLSATTATTDASGIAGISATANGIAGSYAVTASVGGVATPASFALENTPLTATLVLDVSPALLPPNGIATLTATVTSEGPLTPGGTVDFLVDGVVVCADVPVDATGIASCTAGPFGAGQHEVSASYSGDAAHLAASSAAAIGVSVQAPVMVPVAGPWGLAVLVALLALFGAALVPRSRN